MRSSGRALRRASSSPIGRRSSAPRSPPMPSRSAWCGRARADPDESPPATLVLRVEGPAAIEIQHQSAVIVERVNRYFGWQALAGIALRQAPLMRRRTQRPRPAIDQRLAEALSAADDRHRRRRPARRARPAGRRHQTTVKGRYSLHRLLPGHGRDTGSGPSPAPRSVARRGRPASSAAPGMGRFVERTICPGSALWRQAGEQSICRQAGDKGDRRHDYPP